MSTRDEYVRKMHSMLDKWNAEINVLSAKADRAEVEARGELDKQIAALRARQDEARAKLEALHNASEDAWKDFRSGIELAWDAMHEAIESAKSRFNK